MREGAGEKHHVLWPHARAPTTTAATTTAATTAATAAATAGSSSGGGSLGLHLSGLAAPFSPNRGALLTPFLRLLREALLGLVVVPEWVGALSIQERAALAELVLAAEQVRKVPLGKGGEGVKKAME